MKLASADVHTYFLYIRYMTIYVRSSIFSNREGDGTVQSEVNTILRFSLSSEEHVLKIVELFLVG